MSTGNRPNSRQAIGRVGEQLARQYLERSLGWLILRTNWRCHIGELDIVARDGDWLVIVEVRTRTTSYMGTGLESIDGRKARQLRRLVPWVIQELRMSNPIVLQPRLDVIGLVLQEQRLISLQHVRNVLYEDA